MISSNSALIWISLIVGLVKLSLGVYIFKKNSRSKVNQLFSILLLSQALWDIGKFIMWLSTDVGHAMFWAKVSYLGYIVSVVSFPHFCWAYLKRKNVFSRNIFGLFVWYIPLFVMVGFLLMTNMVIARLIPPLQSDFGSGISLWQYSYGALYNYFFQYYQILPFIYGFVVFLKKYFETKKVYLKSQLKYFIIGISFPILIGIPTGVILPIFGIILPPHNNILTLIMSVFLFIGVVKFKFLSVRPMEEPKTGEVDKGLIKNFKVDLAKHYMISHEKSVPISYNIMLDYLWKKKFGIVITTHDPDIIREKFKLKTTPIVWVTDMETDHFSVGPNDIDQLYETIAQFTSKVPNSFVLFEGIGYLIKHNNFNKVVELIRRAKVVVKKNNCCLVIPRGYAKLDKKQEIVLEEELETLPMPRVLKETRELTREDSEKEKRFIILGHNNVSASIINEFETRNIKFTLVALKRDLEIPKKHGKLVIGDPLNQRLLLSLNLDTANTVIIVTLGSDSDSILCVNLLRGITEKAKILLNIDSQEFYKVGKEAGADEVISSLTIGSRLMSLAISSPNIVNWIMDTTTYVSRECELIEVMVMKNSPLCGRSVLSVDSKLSSKANILAVKTKDGLKYIAHDDYILKEDDAIILIADLKSFNLGFSKKNIRKWIESKV